MKKRVKLVTVATATLATIAATNMVSTSSAKAETIESKVENTEKITTKDKIETKNNDSIENEEDLVNNDVNSDKFKSNANRTHVDQVSNLNNVNLSVTSSNDQKENEIDNSLVNTDVKKELYLNQYTVPTGVDNKGNYLNYKRIHNKDNNNPATITIKLHNNGRLSYSTYGSVDTYLNTNTFDIPTNINGYIYDDKFTKQYDPARYLMVNDDGKINLNTIADQQSYAIFYRTPEQVSGQESTLDLDELNRNNSYNSRLDWYDQDTGYYLGSTNINDYSMGIEGHLFDDNLNIPKEYRNNTDFVVHAPKGYKFMVVVKDGKLVTDKNSFTKNDFTAVNEFNYDDPMSGHHPYLDLNFSNDLYHEGIFHANEWAHIQQFDPTEPQNYCAKNLHIFKVFVRYEGRFEEDKEPQNENYPAQEALPVNKIKKTGNKYYDQLIENNIKSHTTDLRYRQVTIAVNDDLTGKNLGLSVIPIDITKDDLELPLLELKDYVKNTPILDDSYGISTWQNIDNQLILEGENLDSHKIHVGKYYVDDSFNESNNHVDYWGNGRLQLWVHKLTQWDTSVSNGRVSFVVNPKIKTLKFMDQNGQIVDWATQTIYGVPDTTNNANVVDLNINIPKGYYLMKGEILPKKYTFTDADNNKYTKDHQISIDNNPIIIRVVKYKDSDADLYAPLTKNIEINDEESIVSAWQLIENISQLPNGTTYFFENSTNLINDSKKIGTHVEYIKVTYPDTSFDLVSFVLSVKKADSKKYSPVSKAVTITAGENLPAAWSLITNIEEMPAGTGYNWSDVDQITNDSKKPGSYTEYVRVTYPDGSVNLQSFLLTVNDKNSEAVKYIPLAKSITMAAGESLPAAWKLIDNLGKMPKDASYDWSNVDQITNDSKKPGSYTEYVKVTYSDGSSNEAKFNLTINS